MVTFRHRLRRFSWLACLALCALVLAPTVSRALAAVQGQPAAWAEVCTPQGLQRVVLDDGSTLPASAVQPMTDHCALCGLASAVPLPPAPAVTAHLVWDGADAVPVLFLHAPRPLHAWTVAQSRAPPQRA